MWTRGAAGQCCVRSSKMGMGFVKGTPYPHFVIILFNTHGPAQPVQRPQAAQAREAPGYLPQGHERGCEHHSARVFLPARPTRARRDGPVRPRRWNAALRAEWRRAS
eukprot:gene18040-biopygen6880